MMYGFEIIAAIANNNVIGYKGKLPWGHLPKDLEHFKKITMNHPVVVGFKTLESISVMAGRNTNLLPGRRIYVLTREPHKLQRFPDCTEVTNIDHLVRMAHRGKIFVAGGHDVYRQFMDIELTRVIHITRIYADYPGDTYFPAVSSGEWDTLNYEFHSSDNNNKHALSFITKVRSHPV